MYFIGVDIGGTKCAVTLAFIDKKDGGCEFLGKQSFATPKNGWQQAVTAMKEAIQHLLDSHQLMNHQIDAIGISCGGPLDSSRGIILSPPNLPGWDEVPIVKIVSSAFSVPVFLQNDANACALAEWKFGAAKNTQNAVFMTFGTGLGAGLILNGRLYEGASRMAGEIGHIRLSPEGPVGYGKAGSFEGFCSGNGIAQIAKNMILEEIQQGKAPEMCPTIDRIHEIDARSVALAAEDGDPLAISIYQKCGCYLGKGLAIIIDILNPEVIVIGSIFTRSRNLLWQKAQEQLIKEALPLSLSCCRIVPAALGEQIGDYAAIAIAQQGLEDREEL